MTYHAQRWMLVFLFFVAGAMQGQAYSVFMHEQLIDLTWNASIRPLLIRRFPHVSETELEGAHAYAFGGCAIQDLGYYPFGKSFFSDLTHYVRTGDFISNLLRDAKTVNEYAFALGALSHYVGDTVGHEDAINPATSIEFPKLAKKFGKSMTYDENPHAHVRTEFGFDIDQLCKKNLAPGRYLRYIGLEVSQDLLDRAFYDTYALHLHEVIGAWRPTFRSYAWAVRSFLPRIAYAELVLHRDQFTAEAGGLPGRTYEEHLAKADFQKIWNQYRGKPGFRTYMVAFLLRIVPKVGPLSVAAIRIPREETEELFIRSVNRTVASFEAQLIALQKNPTTATIANRDLDTGRKIKPGEYPLTDQTYAKLLDVLSKRGGRTVPPELKEEILSYFEDPSVLEHSKLKAGQRQKVTAQAAGMRAGE